MERYAPTLKDLAPRDFISRCMDREIKQGRGCGPQQDCIHLDLTHLGPATIMKRLPSVFEIGRNFADIEFVGGIPGFFKDATSCANIDESLGVLLVDCLPCDAQCLGHLRPAPAGAHRSLDLRVLHQVGQATKRDHGSQSLGGALRRIDLECGHVSNSS